MKLLAREIEDLDKVMKYFINSGLKGLFIMTLGENGSMLIKNGEKNIQII